MRKLRIFAIGALGALLLGAPCGGTPTIVLTSSSMVVNVGQPFTVKVESRNARSGEAFAFRLTYPYPALTLVGPPDLAHGPEDLSVVPNPQINGEVSVHAANTKPVWSTEEPTKGVVLATLQFQAAQPGDHTIHIERGALGQSVPGNPVTQAVPGAPALGADLVIRVDP